MHRCSRYEYMYIHCIRVIALTLYKIGEDYCKLEYTIALEVRY